MENKSVPVLSDQVFGSMEDQFPEAFGARTDYAGLFGAEDISAGLSYLNATDGQRRRDAEREAALVAQQAKLREAAAAGAAQMSGLFDRPTNGYALGNTGYYVTDPTASLSDFAPGLPASTSYNGAVASGGRDPNAVSRYLNSAGEIVVVSGDLPQVPEGWEYLHDNALIVSERGVTPAEFAITALGFATFGAAPALYAGLANTGRGIYQAGQAVYGSYRAYGAAATAATYNYELSVGAILTAEAGAALTGAYYGEAALVMGGVALGVGKTGYSRAGVGNSSVGRTFTYNAVENPGPLALLPGRPAANFYGGRYNATELADDLVLYRGGKAGEPLGQWFTREAPESVAQIRIDSAVKPQWVDPKTGVLTGTSEIDSLYAIRIPKGTTIYEGPVGYQGGVHLGGINTNQVFVPTPWNIKGVQVINTTPIR